MDIKIGVAHVHGYYSPNHFTTSFLLEGADQVKLLGVKTIKVYLSPDYTTLYPDTWIGSITSITDLASTTQFQTLFSDPFFETYIINTFTFVNGINNPWRQGVTPIMLANEKAEMKALAQYLINTYAGTNKTFILQNWEGDWALLGAFDETLRVPNNVADYMIAFLRSRQDAIKEAREGLGLDGVRVLHSIEANRVLDGTLGDSKVRLVNSVLPKLYTDMVSYSAYDSTVYFYGSNQQEMLDKISELLPKAIKALKRSVKPGTPIYIGEYGLAENELPAGYSMDTIIRHITNIADQEGLKYIIYWQIFDNECTGPVNNPTCRGFWLILPNGDTSTAGFTIMDLAS